MQAPNSPTGLTIHAHAMQEHCIWDDYAERLAKLRGALERTQRRTVGSAYTSMLLWDDPELHARCARLEVPAYLPASRQPRAPTKDGKIRIAYVSGDLRQHAVSMLIPGLLESHDREQFDVTAVSLSADDGSAERARIVKSVDCFLDADQLTGPQIAALLRERQIDIAVDLMGHTRNARPAIFLNRAAPIQVNYLGFPGTTAMTWHDYIVADPFMVTNALRKATTEKLVILPDCYLPTDDKRAVAEKPTRGDCSLPENAFVFATFNQSRKITPDTFEVWMSILREVDSSILWMRKGSDEATRNLRAEAERRGVASERSDFCQPRAGAGGPPGSPRARRSAPRYIPLYFAYDGERHVVGRCSDPHAYRQELPIACLWQLANNRRPAGTRCERLATVQIPGREIGARSANVGGHSVQAGECSEALATVRHGALHSKYGARLPSDDEPQCVQPSSRRD